jgi:hypothetical protein
MFVSTDCDTLGHPGKQKNKPKYPKIMPPPTMGKSDRLWVQFLENDNFKNIKIKYVFLHLD